MRAWATMLLALLSLPVTAADVTREVPDQFLGDWCTVPLSDEEDTGESDIRIGKSEITYYQSVGKILAAAAEGDELALIVQVTATGDTRLVTHEFELSSSGDKLTSLRPDGQLHVRRRCGASLGTPGELTDQAQHPESPVLPFGLTICSSRALGRQRNREVNGCTT